MKYWWQSAQKPAQSWRSNSRIDTVDAKSNVCITVRSVFHTLKCVVTQSRSWILIYHLVSGKSRRISKCRQTRNVLLIPDWWRTWACAKIASFFHDPLPLLSWRGSFSWEDKVHGSFHFQNSPLGIHQDSFFIFTSSNTLTWFKIAVSLTYLKNSFALSSKDYNSYWSY